MSTPEVERFRPQQRQRYVNLVLDTLVVVVAVLGGVAALSGAEGSRGLAVGALAAAALGLAARLLLRARVQRRGVLGAALTARTLVVCGCAVLLGHAADLTQVLGAALGAALLVGGVAGEPYLRRAARFNPPVVANLPGVPSPPHAKSLRGWLVATSLTATIVGVVVAVLGASTWWWVAAAALALVLPAVVAVRGRRQILTARRLRTQVPKAVADYAPEFVLYTSRPDDASYQVTMWLPYLKRAGRRFLIITRNGTPARALAELTDVPVVEARKISDLDALVPPSLKAAFYVNASSGNGVFVRYQHLTHIYLGHGDSDKPPSYNPTHAMYDRVFAAGPAATRRYAAHGVHIPADKFQIVGRPQVEDVAPATRPISEVPEPVVLYAPTWRGHVEETMLYSLPVGERIVSGLLARGATVIFRPHPFSYDFPDDADRIARIQSMLEADTRATGRAHLYGAAAETERGILDCINASDAMVSDVSSVVSDYLFSAKPFAMVAVPSEPEPFVEEYPVARAAYVVRSDLSNLQESLEQMLGPDPLAAQREAIRVDYLGAFPAEGYADAFVEAIRHVTSKPSEDDEETDDEGEEPGGGATAVGWSGYRRLLGSVGLNLAGTVLALSGLTAALLGAPGLVILALCVIGVGIGMQSVVGDLTDLTRWGRLLNKSTVTRAVVVLTTAVVLADRGALTGTAVLALALLAVGVSVEAHILSAWGGGGLQVANFSPVRASVNEPVPRGVTALVSCITSLAVLALALLPAPGWLLAGLAGVATLFTVDALVRALLRASRVRRAEGRLRGALADYAPEFAVYFASTVGAAYQVGMWLPFFARIGLPFVVVTRSVAMMREIATVTAATGVDVPVIHRPTLRSLEDVIAPSLTTAFYVNNAVRNTHFVERRELTHVWLNHGDSEKPACYNPVHAIYDVLFTAGQAGIDRYARHGIDIPAEKFRIVGRPQVESVLPARGPIAEQPEPTVLYAPTWQGPFADTRVYSLPLGREIVEELLARGVRVIFRAHPFNYRFPICVEMINDIGKLLAADKAATGRRHLWGPAAEREMTIEDCFNASDAMISDVSAVVSDYLHSDKPFAIVSVGRTPEELLEEA
ncbi:MAG TPA: CDP-glycerol glycerophosphotransferase family protein, partial [Propionibacteriaceae bacterium]